MKDELGLSREEIVVILKQNGRESFNIDDVADYTAMIRGHMTLKLGIMDKMSQPDKIPRQCPVPGCAGVKDTDRLWGWTCSLGGLRHYIVWHTAETIVGREADLDEVQEKAVWLLEQMEVLDAAKEKENEARQEEGTCSVAPLSEESVAEVRAEPQS